MLALPGSLSAVHLIAKVFVDEGTNVAMENPGFPYARQVFQALGANIVPIDVDEQGIIVDNLKKTDQDIHLVYVCPSHQDPTGAVLTLERRHELLRWAKEKGAIIIEDDYDSEIRHGGLPLPSMQGLDENESVIYLSSFWKALFPLVNLGYMIVPQSLIPVFRHAQLMRDNPLTSPLPTVEQKTLAEFITDGYLERSIRRSQTLLSARWRATVMAMTKHFREIAVWSKESSGSHVTVRFNENIPLARILECAQACALPLASTEPYYLGEARPNEFMMPIADAAELEIQQRIKLFAETLRINLDENTQWFIP